MSSKKLLLSLLVSCSGIACAHGANVSVVMNSTSKTMTLESKTTGETIDTGEPGKNYSYSFEAEPGDYILTAYSGTTVNGTMEITIADSEATQEFKVLTCTVYATNKGWTVANGDYTIDAIVNTREGKQLNVTLGESTTANRFCMLALNGNSYYVDLIPSEAHQAEGYTTLSKAGTLTFGATISGAIPLGGEYTISLPVDAELEVGFKRSHFTDFDIKTPIKTEVDGDTKSITYYLAQGQVYNYRTYKNGGLTQAGYFNYAADEAKRPVLNFTESDYTAVDPTTIYHDPTHNKGYETGNIFVNINERGHLALNVGDVYKAHAMRSWELTDNSTNNYFIEPDFHYTVLNLDGEPSNDVIEITGNPTSSWADIKAIGNGTAIVLVTYDAIGLNYYSGADKKEYLGGEYWSAIWPENTAVYVVTVGESASTVVPNMVINEEYNNGALKAAGNYVDAEHDVFYYLDSEEGATYTFTPEGVEDITIAYPTIGSRTVSFSGFGKEGVTKNDDDSYTILLKEGRQIVKMTDVNGNAIYQVITAKPCHREITNVTSPDSDKFYPGDELKIQYSGLHHPANKMAGIYNMSAYITYNGVPNGTSLILGAGQYNFGSVPSAQAVSFKIPEDFDTSNNSEIEMTEGVIQVNGYGDPIGNHRFIDPVAGRSPNFTAVAHKTYFGTIPDIKIPVTAKGSSSVEIVNADNDTVTRWFNLQGIEVAAPTEGTHGIFIRVNGNNSTKVRL